jgi:hypothetical protein
MAAVMTDLGSVMMMTMILMLLLLDLLMLLLDLLMLLLDLLMVVLVMISFVMKQSVIAHGLAVGLLHPFLPLHVQGDMVNLGFNMGQFRQGSSSVVVLERRLLADLIFLFFAPRWAADPVLGQQCPKQYIHTYIHIYISRSIPIFIDNNYNNYVNNNTKREKYRIPVQWEFFFFFFKKYERRIHTLVSKRQRS